MSLHQHHDFPREHLRSVAQHHREQKSVDVLKNHNLIPKPFFQFPNLVFTRADSTFSVDIRPYANKPKSSIPANVIVLPSKMLKVNESPSIGLFVVSGSIKKLFLIGCANIYLFLIIFSI